MPPKTNPQNVPTGKKSIVAVGSLARIAANIRDSHHEAMISPENAPSIAVKQPKPLDGTVVLLVSECSDAANGLVSTSFTNASSFPAANDPHHGAAGVDIDSKIRWPPPLPCMRWFVGLFPVRVGPSKGSPNFINHCIKSIKVLFFKIALRERKCGLRQWQR